MGNFVCWILLAVFVSVTVAKTCREQADCKCGEVCVRKQKAPCNASQDNKSCKCRRGCLLGAQYFKPDESRRTYCNQCTCRSKPKKASMMLCTRMPWCDLPANYPLYHDQPQCSEIRNTAE